MKKTVYSMFGLLLVLGALVWIGGPQLFGKPKWRRLTGAEMARVFGRQVTCNGCKITVNGAMCNGENPCMCVVFRPGFDDDECTTQSFIEWGKFTQVNKGNEDMMTKGKKYIVHNPKTCKTWYECEAEDAIPNRGCDDTTMFTCTKLGVVTSCRPCKKKVPLQGTTSINDDSCADCPP
ncbi:MAG: hypothetical protein K2W96_24820 [Gemmataceae bacterium]|nr:hypothetical protein [Gemmataceae bacterium]